MMARNNFLFGHCAIVRAECLAFTRCMAWSFALNKRSSNGHIINIARKLDDMIKNWEKAKIF
jgi:hypothetical protein